MWLKMIALWDGYTYKFKQQKGKSILLWKMKVFCLLGGQDEHQLQQSMLLYYGSCFLLHSSLGSLKQFLVFLEV